MESPLGTEVSATVQTAVTIDGRVLYCRGGFLSIVQLLLTGSTVANAVTDINGHYSFLVPLGGSYLVMPSKTPLAPATGPINTVDVIACQRHYLGLVSLTGCTFTAGDVNKTGRIDTVDVIAI